MAFGDVIQQVDFGAYGASAALPSAVTAGNSILLISTNIDANGGELTSVSDDVNGAYTEVAASGVYGVDTSVSKMFLLSGTATGTTTITLSYTDNPIRTMAFEIEGQLSPSGDTGTGFGTGTTITSSSVAIPANSVSFAAVSDSGPQSVFPSAPWTVAAGVGTINLAERADASGTTDDFSATLNTTPADGWSVAWRSFVQASSGPDYTLRKGSTLDGVTHGLGTITTATLNSVNVFDHVSSQAAGAVSFAGAATDEITTSGTYTLTLGDGATTEDITVQVNVVGLPSNTAKKDGGLLVSLTDLTLDAFNASGTLVDSLTGITTNASGVISPVDLSGISEAVGDTLKVSLHSAASDVGVTFEQALELI